VADQARHPGEVEIALWFHDAVYDVKGKDNELRSARWAAQVLGNSGVDEAACRRVQALIMATCHESTPEDDEARLLVDRPGHPRCRPRPVCRVRPQVRAEYAWVPRPIYALKRRQVLQGLSSAQGHLRHLALPRPAGAAGPQQSAAGRGLGQAGVVIRAMA
jgi:predicted metal-dependent HD superfamily phosphohydrolase